MKCVRFARTTVWCWIRFYRSILILHCPTCVCSLASGNWSAKWNCRTFGTMNCCWNCRPCAATSSSISTTNRAALSLFLQRTISILEDRVQVFQTFQFASISCLLSSLSFITQLLYYCYHYYHCYYKNIIFVVICNKIIIEFNYVDSS